MLYLVSTPIGNSKDLGLRAIELIEKADIILAEDTRVFHQLTLRLNIETKAKIISFYDHNEKSRLDEIVDYLRDDKLVVQVSDAGTPLIQDPGYNLVQKCIENNIEFTAIPGPAAFLDALILSGFPPYPFTFYGFMPLKSGGRNNILNEVKVRAETSIFYESPYRIEKSLQAISEIFGQDKQVAVCRELTKKYESVLRGPVSKVINEVKPKGEFVLIL